MKNKCNFIFLLLTLTSCSNNVTTSTNSSSSNISSTNSTMENIVQNNLNNITKLEKENISNIYGGFPVASYRYDVEKQHIDYFYDFINIEYTIIELDYLQNNLNFDFELTFCWNIEYIKSNVINLYCLMDENQNYNFVFENKNIMYISSLVYNEDLKEFYQLIGYK